jgi:hypothetical protein
MMSVDRPHEEHAMSNAVYTSRVRIVRQQGPLRHAELPATDELVRFGVHGAVAEHYGVDAREHDPTATTLDYVIAATGG